ncbi:phosphatidylethanolamine-binding protein [Xylariomycetidae sp. FL0641]|nr:phosphatidylethanolamine-binding protein [Xylariomycetidae sp. FL0641]
MSGILRHLLLAATTITALSPEQKPLVSDTDLSKVRDALKSAEIIPTVIPDFTPSLFLSASWSDDTSASLGNEVSVDAVQDSPRLRLRRPSSSSADETSYAVALTDPDAPSRANPEWAEICHWLVTNVTSSSSSSSATDLMPYKPPGPPPETGAHRYVFLAFAAANGTAVARLNLTAPADRKHWGYGEPGMGVWAWAEENGLEPVAANFVYAQNEEQ